MFKNLYSKMVNKDQLHPKGEKKKKRHPNEAESIIELLDFSTCMFSNTGL